MDIGTIERGIVIRIDGEGKLIWSHEGLTPTEIMGLLAMVQIYAMDDLKQREERTQTAGEFTSLLKRIAGRGS